MPLLQILGVVWPLYADWLAEPNFWYCIFLGGTAALFEEGGRYLVMLIFLKNEHTDIDGIAFGIGHGGIEAILFVGINAVIMFVNIWMGNLANQDTLVISNLFLAGGERIFTMFFHIAWSLMLMKAIQNRKPMLLMLAFITHALLDTVLAYLAILSISIWVIEAILGLLTILPVVYIIKVSRKDKKENPNIFMRIGEKNGDD
jgi:uncharacterized membrane protein YhfC